MSGVAGTKMRPEQAKSDTRIDRWMDSTGWWDRISKGKENTWEAKSEEEISTETSIGGMGIRQLVSVLSFERPHKQLWQQLWHQ